ncbi:MAG: polysaccharide pyruvyl transferase family protein [Spirochaetota bacterium]
MNIGVMGYYGYGNAGDDVILQILRNYLSPHNVIPVQTGFLADNETIRRLNDFDFLILGGGGLFNDSPTGPFHNFDQWMSYLETPIGVLGVGIKKINKEFIVPIHALVERSRFFVVRDKESQDLIGLPKVQLAPDLTFYQPQRVNPYQRISNEQVICGINLRPARKGTSEWVRSISLLPCTKRAIPFSVVPAFDDRDPLLAIDENCPVRFNLQAYFGLDMVIGVAFHSIVFAIQNGIPSIAINYHPKVKRLMEDMGLGDYSLDWNNSNHLESAYFQVLRNYDMIRDTMINYTEQAHREIVEKLKVLKNEIDKNVHAVFAFPNGKQNPKATIIVDFEHVDARLMKTIESSCAQTINHVNIILVTSSDISSLTLPFWAEQKVSKKIVNHKEQDWVKTALQFVDGEYVLWLKSGDYLAQDTLALLTESISESNAIGLAYSDYYLIDNDIIERKVDPRNNPFERYLGPYGPCFLVRNKHASELRTIQLTGEVSREFDLVNKNHIGHGLMFIQACIEAIDLYRSAISFGYGDVESGKKYLKLVLEKLSRTENWKVELEKIFHFFWNTPFEITYYVDPKLLVELVIRNFPDTTIWERRLRNIFDARVSVANAFRFRKQANPGLTRNFLFRAVKKDPLWLTNKGVLSLFVKSFFRP